jgi:uncharacterized protein (TIGR02246 family)
VFDLQTFYAAWSSRDADRCAALMHPDGTWLYTQGEVEAGNAFHGRAAIRAAAASMFAALPDAAFEPRGAVRIEDQRLLVEWVLAATTRSGRGLRAHGLDLLTLDPTGLILLKDSYLKHTR